MENIGLVTYWRPSGQATVMRDIKSILDESGKYNTHVLFRRSNDNDWKGEGNFTQGPSTLDIPFKFYQKWIIDNNITKIIFFQNYQFDVIAKIRKMRIKTYGTFMWERFRHSHAKIAAPVYHKIFSLHPTEKQHYLKNFNLDSNYIRWGIHPRLLKYRMPLPDISTINFAFPIGAADARRNYQKTVNAFINCNNSNIRLNIYSKGNIGRVKNIKKDSRITISSQEVIKDDDIFYQDISKNNHVFILPSKWEGLGLSFYEGLAMARPIITTNAPPMNDHVINQETGLLLNSFLEKYKPSGIPIVDFSTNELTKLIDDISNIKAIENMSINTINMTLNKYSWRDTKKDILNLVKD